LKTSRVGSLDSPPGRQGRGTAFLLFAALSWPVPIEAQTARPAIALSGLCGVVEARAQDPAQRPPPQEQPANEPPSNAQQLPPPEKPRPPEVARPPQEQEIKELGSVLSALASAETSGPALKALAEGRPFSLERFAAVLGDVRSIVTHLHARALLDRLGEAKGVEAETRRWIEHNARVMEDCAPSRFESRGGLATYRQVLAAVSKHRSQLEPFLFQEAQPPVTPPADQGAEQMRRERQGQRP
jgi:hypothetical protein